jgi:hypothetical protein
LIEVGTKTLSFLRAKDLDSPREKLLAKQTEREIPFANEEEARQAVEDVASVNIMVKNPNDTRRVGEIIKKNEMFSSVTQKHLDRQQSPNQCWGSSTAYIAKHYSTIIQECSRARPGSSTQKEVRSKFRSRIASFIL